MKVKIGNLWDEVETADLILVTTNASINASGALVMGRGAARELRDRVPGFDRAVAGRIKDAGSPYGVIVTGYRMVNALLGIFQVKHHWAADADPLLIAFSTGALCQLLRSGKYSRVAMNYPGIGNGRLSEEVVAPILEPLPDFVTVYKRR